MEKRYIVRLTDDQRAALEERFTGPLTLRQRNRVQVLLRADRDEADGEIAAELGISTGTALNTRRRFATEGLDAALTERPRRGVPAKLDGKAEAMVIALACSKAPDGRARWTAKMLANRLVELEVVESVSDDTILRVLKKTRSSRGRSGRGACRRA
jgi:transposase